MSKIIVRIQLFLDKVFGHKYTGFTIKAPFINFSFAPTKLIQIALTDTDFFIGWFCPFPIDCIAIIISSIWF